MATYERCVLAVSKFFKQGILHLDMGIHSYVEQDLPERQVWREGGHIIDLFCRNFGVTAIQRRPELYFVASEEKWIRQWLEKQKLKPGSYIVVEPHTKEDWFGKLRAWPFERWTALFQTDALRGERGVVQVGLKGKAVLPGVLDQTGRLSFRETALVMREAELFIGTEGGLMHAAAAVGVPSVILYGGITRPEFSGYPELQSIVCNYVECIHCGLKGDCPNDHICMNSITVEQVADAIRESLSR